jgi:ribose/xylose/arabinose/galactoside ABC-type transport system permease subunit
LVAGASAIGVALFPTGKPEYADVPLTSLQKLIGETATTWTHYTASASFLVSLGVVTFCFGIREGNRPQRPGKRSPAFWRWFHWTCAGLMGLAIVWIVVTMSVGWPPRALLYGEWIASWAFGASWLWKGAELDMLFGKPAEPRR